ncbi:restriction endonuclease [Streptomyces sp. NPDC049915]|uniref:restriction endonuclease n=1 Tax=Streptomyces sp. NPDC049915 TaxID=3155510 RepID=UPI00343915C3
MAEPEPCSRVLKQLALQLTGPATAVAADVKRHAAQLSPDSGPRALAEVVLAEAERRLSAPPQATVHSVQHRARLVRALYERLDRIQAAAPATVAGTC